MIIKLNEERTSVFKKHFLEPVQRLEKEDKIENPKDYHNSHKYRTIWLQQGTQDFDNLKIANCPLTSYELVDLYCYYYLQMHYSSSMAVFNSGANTIKQLCNPQNTIHFIDIGCGPTTSGIAFNYWMEDNVINDKKVMYYGIDSSNAMLSKAKDLLSGNNYFNFYGNYFPHEAGDDALLALFNSIDELNLTIDTPNKHIAIINCCYLFASESLDVNQLVEGINSKISSMYDTYIVYQNPADFDVPKWASFKSKLSGFNSVKNYPQVLKFSFHSITQDKSFTNWNVCVDILKNF